MSSIRELLEGKQFYRKRQYKSKFYDIPLPYRALSEYELWECESKSFEEIENKEDLMDLKPDQKLTAEQAISLAKASKISDYWVVFYSMREYVEGLTIELVKRVRGVSELARKIREESGVGREEEIKDF